jgi:hypothetical protein
MKELHCSDLPRVCRCPASLTPPSLTIRGSNPAAAIGSAVHEALADVPNGKRPDLLAISEKYGVEKDAVIPLFYAGVRLLEELSPNLDVIGTEVRLETELLFEGETVRVLGTADLLATVKDDPGILLVADYKSGVEKNFTEQLQGYAVLAHRKYADIERFKLAVLMLRSGETIIVDMDPAEALADLKTKLARSLASPNTYSPSFDNCSFCPRAIECPGRTALVRQSVLDLTTAQETMDAAPPAVLAGLYDKAKLLEKVLEHFQATLRNAVMQAGELSVGDGRVLYFKDRNQSPIDAAKAWPVLIQQFGSVEKFADALTIGKGELCDTIRRMVPKGKGAGAIREFMAALDAAGAVEHKTSKVLTIRREGSNGNESDGE